MLQFCVHIVFHSGKWWNQKVLLSDSHMLCTFSKTRIPHKTCMSVGTHVLLWIIIIDDIILVLPVCVIRTDLLIVSTLSQILVFKPEQYSSPLHMYHNWVIVDTLRFVASDDGLVKLKQLVESYMSQVYVQMFVRWW